MSDPMPPMTADAPRVDESLVTYTHVIYALHALSVLIGFSTFHTIVGSFIWGLPSIVAVIMNYARRSATLGTYLESHFRWQIRTFWFAWLWIIVTVVVSTPLVLVAFLGVATGIIGIGLTGLWVIYRIVRGWLTLRDRKAMPLP